MVKQGDIIKINFNPQVGHEQSGYRPACIVSNRVLNNHSVMYYCCPITNTGHIFGYELVDYKDVQGFVLIDQLKSVDLTKRKYKHITHLNDKDLKIILERINMLLEMED